MYILFTFVFPYLKKNLCDLELLSKYRESEQNELDLEIRQSELDLRKIKTIFSLKDTSNKVKKRLKGNIHTHVRKD